MERAKDMNLKDIISRSILLARLRSFVLKGKNADENRLDAFKRMFRQLDDDITADQKAELTLERLVYSKEIKESWDNDNLKKDLMKLSRQLPIWKKHFKDVKGLSELGLGMIIGYSGDISYFKSKSALEKYMEVGIVNGEIQHRCRGDKEKAKIMKYGGVKRSVMWNQAGYLISFNDGMYRDVFDRQILNQAGKSDKLIVTTSNSRKEEFRERYGIEPEVVKQKDLDNDKDKQIKDKEFLSLYGLRQKGNRAISQRLLREIYRVWNENNGVSV